MVMALLLLSGGIARDAVADSGAALDAMAWLKKIASASRQINYAGAFVYHHGNQVETSRIAHFVDANGEHERLEMLDGPSREIMRDNDRVTCYLPDDKTVVIEQRDVRRFPELLSEQLSGLADNYVIRKGDRDRVAGYECQMIVLEPKDNLRYGHRFCAELVTGLPLRARTVNESRELVESFAFTQLKLGSAVNKDLLKSRYAGKSQNWRVDKSALAASESGAGSGWELKGELPGFRKLTEMKRSIAGHSDQVSQIVYSDGLAAVSVFIEPTPKNPPPPGPARHGAVNIFVKSQADQMITVVGDAPSRTVKQVAELLGPKDN